MPQCQLAVWCVKALCNFWQTHVDFAQGNGQYTLGVVKDNLATNLEPALLCCANIGPTNHSPGVCALAGTLAVTVCGPCMVSMGPGGTLPCLGSDSQ